MSEYTDGNFEYALDCLVREELSRRRLASFRTFLILAVGSVFVCAVVAVVLRYLAGY